MRNSLVRGHATEPLDLVPSKIIGIGVNYRGHAIEMGEGLPEEPLMFLKPTSTLIGGGEPLARPAGDVIWAGTPSSVGNLSPGGMVEIEGIGVLGNPVIARP
jgi:2-keto-4-pentenoate hydratase/2-oxohepta-3-ene-1,7-dioic acid hydratase in catechol pathway